MHTFLVLLFPLSFLCFCFHDKKNEQILHIRRILISWHVRNIQRCFIFAPKRLFFISSNCQIDDEHKTIDSQMKIWSVERQKIFSFYVFCYLYRVRLLAKNDWKLPQVMDDTKHESFFVYKWIENSLIANGSHETHEIHCILFCSPTQAQHNNNYIWRKKKKKTFSFRKCVEKLV